MSAENRAILLTPKGPGAIAVIRITGPNVATFLESNFTAKPLDNRCVHGNLLDAQSQVLDDIVTVLHAEGQSADLNLHGGPWLVESALSLLQSNGFELCETPPLDTFDGDDIFEREMLVHLPLAKTEESIRMLLAQPQAWRSFLASNPTSQIKREIANDKTLDRLFHPAHVAIVGLPNVGKSTLANQLFGQQRSITADVPGTTRDWIGELANLDGVPILLLDTPGLRDSEDRIEQSAIALSRGVIERADLTIVVIDPTQPLDPQFDLAATFAHRLIVANKRDRMTDEVARSLIPIIDAATTATTGDGIDELRQLIRQKLGVRSLDPTKPRCWTQRQRDFLQRPNAL